MRTWIFQGNPDRYDIDAYLAARPAELLWLVTRYEFDISVGDRVYLWRNQGAAGAVAGVIAEGIITAPPTLRVQDAESVRYWRTKKIATTVSQAFERACASSRLRAPERSSSVGGVSKIRSFETCPTSKCKRQLTIPSTTIKPVA